MNANTGVYRPEQCGPRNGYRGKKNEEPFRQSMGKKGEKGRMNRSSGRRSFYTIDALRRIDRRRILCTAGWLFGNGTGNR